jgi:arylsulfatase A-like enzyme
MAKPRVRNVLLITLDQFRADCLSAAGHPLVQTPNLDALAASGVRFASHYSQAAPCGPGRAALYTGTYQMNNRVVANGTPLAHRFTNIALEVRKAGYDPVVFGYTDVAIDPRSTTGPDDPRLDDYEGLLEGMTHALDLSDNVTAWRGWIAERGHEIPSNGAAALKTEPTRSADLSMSAFMTDELIGWIGNQSASWFAHASYLRPHPPYTAAGDFATMYDPADVPDSLPADPDIHPLFAALHLHPHAVAPSLDALRTTKAQYFGMISEVDAQLGRLWAALKGSGAWEETLVVLTADHADQMGDRGLIGKLGFYPESFHIPGIVMHPGHRSTAGSVVQAYSENVDVMPTILEALSLEVPLQCDGYALTPFLAGEQPVTWRDAVHHEFDWRDLLIGDGAGSGIELGPWPWDRRLEQQHLAVLHDETGAYVHFGDGSSLCFDLATDPTWRTLQRDPAVVLGYAQRMLTWRSTHAERTLTDFLTLGGGRGRWPAGVPWRTA